jgi:hypothetical protein
MTQRLVGRIPSPVFDATAPPGWATSPFIRS